MEFKAHLMDEAQLRRSVARISHEIIEKNNGVDGLCLLGIRRRGVPLAHMIADNIYAFEGKDVPVAPIAISLYRDDLSEMGDQARTGSCEIPIDLKDHTIILVDDVIYTGRTVRAGIEAVFAHGRPKSIQLAVLVDRGHRELPLRPDYVGKNVPTSRSELVAVCLPEFDGKMCVDLYSM